jgi:hypothetical protein
MHPPHRATLRPHPIRLSSLISARAGRLGRDQTGGIIGRVCFDTSTCQRNAPELPFVVERSTEGSSLECCNLPGVWCACADWTRSFCLGLWVRGVWVGVMGLRDVFGRGCRDVCERYLDVVACSLVRSPCWLCR